MGGGEVVGFCEGEYGWWEVVAVRWKWGVWGIDGGEVRGGACFDAAEEVGAEIWGK